MTVDSMRSTSLTMEEDNLNSGLSGKTNFSRPPMVKASVQDLKSPCSLQGFKEVTQNQPLIRLP